MAEKAAVEDVLRYLDEFKGRVADHIKIIAGYTADLLKTAGTVMVYSSSATVVASLKYARQKDLRFRIVALESRPMNEGIDMLKQLTKASIPAVYTTDAAGMSMLAEGGIDTVIIGGDAIHPDGLVCKTGSKAIAVLCKANNVNLYGLCATEKIIPSEYKDRFVISDKPAKELTAFKSRFAEIINRYFEIVPFELFSRVITDAV